MIGDKMRRINRVWVTLTESEVDMFQGLLAGLLVVCFFGSIVDIPPSHCCDELVRVEDGNRWMVEWVVKWLC